MKNEDFNKLIIIIAFTSLMFLALMTGFFMSVGKKLDRIENKIDTIGTVIEATDCKF